MLAKTSTVFGAIVSWLALATSASPAVLNARATKLGGVDVQLACEVQNYDEHAVAITIGSGNGDWRCNLSNGSQVSVNMNAACASQYDLPQAYASSGVGVYSWACYE